jgi:hypothetical protein
VSFYTGTQSEVIFANGFAYPAAAASSSAAQNMMAAASGKNQQPVFPGGFFQQGRQNQVVAVDFSVIVAGQGSATTMTITAGLNTNSGTISGSSTLVASQAFTITSFAAGTAAGRIIISNFGSGYGTGATGTETNLWSSMMIALNNGGTLTGSAISATGPTNLTTIDFSLNQWLSLAVTFSTASASNSATLQQIIVSGLN